LSQASRHFCSGYFGDRVSVFAQAGFDFNPPILHCCHSWGWQECSIRFSFFHWDEVSRTFFFYPGSSVVVILLIWASWVAWMIGTHHWVQLSVETGSSTFTAGLTSNNGLPDLSLPSS
jgi:hypothetical protein